MKDFLNRFKIPTILGLGIIVAGIVSGVFLTLREQTFISKASPDARAQNITLSNISDHEVTISWETQTEAISFLTFGQTNVKETTVLDDRDTNPAPDGAGPNAYSLHYVTIKNLLPQTTYQYQIVSGKILSQINQFTTSPPLTEQTGLRPIIGSILDGVKALDEGIVYLSIANASTQSALVKTSGNFLIPLSQIRTADLAASFPLTEETVAKLTIVSAKGTANALFKLKDAKGQLPPLRIGENLDLTETAGLDKYDLNEDGKINSADYATILQNLGNPADAGPQNQKADLNRDGVVDQKDLDLMTKKINQ